MELEAVRQLATDARLATIRLAAATSASTNLRAAGLALQLEGALFGDGRVSGTSPRGNGDDAQVAVGVLAQIAADLIEASASLLSGSNHYAGAALLRQVVEVEYLTWAFAKGEREADAWLNSSHQERQRLFTPGAIRAASGGRFQTADYQHHCEQGGHPVPKAISLLDHSESSAAQMLLLDLLLHGWRTTDNLIEWAKQRSSAELVATALKASQLAFSNWGQADPLYAWALTAPPALPP